MIMSLGPPTGTRRLICGHTLKEGLLFLFLILDRGSPRSVHWPGSHYVKQAGLKLRRGTPSLAGATFLMVSLCLKLCLQTSFTQFLIKCLSL